MLRCSALRAFSTMPSNKLVTFDAFGTLFSPRHPIPEIYALIGLEHGYQVYSAALKPAFRKAYTEQTKRKPRYGITNTSSREEYDDLCRDWWTEVIEMSFKANKVDVSKEFCHNLYLHYSSADAYKLHSDVKTCLERLSSASVTMGVVSDFDVRLQGILEGLGIGSYFQFVIQSLVEGYSKPSKELWEAALQKAGSVDEGYHVGDDPNKDAFADAKIIILDREYNITTDFTKISSLEELPNILNI